MSASDLLEAFPWIRETEMVTITVPLGTLMRALEMSNGGPEVMTTAVAAQRFGWTSRRWRKWAEAKRVEDAWQDETGHWRLPRESCRALVETLRRSRPAHGRVRKGVEIAPAGPVAAKAPTRHARATKSIRRGPRR